MRSGLIIYLCFYLSCSSRLQGSDDFPVAKKAVLSPEYFYELSETLRVRIKKTSDPVLKDELIKQRQALWENQFKHKPFK